MCNKSARGLTRPGIMIVLDYLYFHPFKFGALSMAMCDAGLTQQVLNSQYHPP